MIHFAESSTRAAEIIKKNLTSLGITTGFQIINRDSIRGLRLLDSAKITADIVFLDPPYEMEKAYQQTLQTLSKSHTLKPESIVIAEHQKKFDPGEAFESLRRYRKLEQGDAALSFYHLAPAQ